MILETDITKSSVNHLLHEWANFLNLIYLTESDVDISNVARVLQFARAVYLNHEPEQVIALYNERHLSGEIDCAIVGVLWYLYEKKSAPIQIEPGYILCSVTLRDFKSWPPIQYLQQKGYIFNIELHDPTIVKITFHLINHDGMIMVG